MFSGIRLQNIRSFSQSKWIPLKPLTILVGPNNAGKSTVLNALLLLAQSVRPTSNGEPLVTSGPIVDLGSFYDILRGGSSAKKRSISIDLKLSREHVEDAWAEYEFHPDRVAFHPGTELRTHFSFNPNRDQIEVDSSYFFRDRRLVLGVDRLQSEGSGESLKLRGRLPGTLSQYQPKLSGFLPSIAPQELEDDEDSLPDISAMRAQVDSLAQSGIWGEALRDVELVAPLREPIPRFTFLGRTGPAVRGVSSGGEAVLELLRTAEKARRKGNEPVVEAVDYWLSKRFRLTRDLRILDVDRASRVLSLVADQKGGFSGINVANLGEGVSQLLPIVASLVMLQKRQTVLIEQPEIHLHPAAQAELGDLFISGIADTELGQVIVETHSEHLLLRVRRRIAEGKVDPTLVGVLFVEKPGASSRIRHLSLDSLGNFEDWPDGFFDEAYQEALQLSMAADKR